MLGVHVLLLLLTPKIGWAAGTLAGTIINNTVSLDYSLDGEVQTPVSASATVKVDELIHPVLTWQDAAPVTVNVPDSNDALTFLLANSGNGREAFSLTRTNGPLPLPAGNYIPLDGSIGSIYLENGLQPGFQANGPDADTVYVAGANDPDLAPDAGQILYVLSDTPAVGANIMGEVLLTAASLTAGAAGAAPGTGLAGLGQEGSFAVVGFTRAQITAKGSYLTDGLGLAINKTVAAVLDPKGTDLVMPGAVMTYQIAVALSGTGTAANLVIADPLPAETTYVPGSISVNGAARTDSADADDTQFSANTVSVSLGNVAAPANFVITFRATIN